MNSDEELLTRVIGAIDKRDFFRSTLLKDTFDDWNLAKDLGEFLVRIEPVSEVMGHALLARAHRHLGNPELALAELKQCQARTANRELEPWEVEMLLPLLEEEERLLSGGSARSEPDKS
jgi:hypothetical protein